jgi:hypothetical protein
MGKSPSIVQIESLAKESGGGHHNVAVCINPIVFQLGSQVPELNLFLNATDDFHNAPATFRLGGIIADTLPKNC